LKLPKEATVPNAEDQHHQNLILQYGQKFLREDPGIVILALALPSTNIGQAQRIERRQMINQ